VTSLPCHLDAVRYRSPVRAVTLARLSSSDVMRDEREALAMSALPPEADIWAGLQRVCFGPTTEVQVGLLATCFLASG